MGKASDMSHREQLTEVQKGVYDLPQAAEMAQDMVQAVVNARTKNPQLDISNEWVHAKLDETFDQKGKLVALISFTALMERDKAPDPEGDPSVNDVVIAIEAAVRDAITEAYPLSAAA